jgi:hypothetical protein
MNYKFYLKKLTSNELGYRNQELKTGQIFYISKQAVEFFPPLRSDVNNDSVNIQINLEYRENPIFVNLVYHNDKFNREDGTRDEYRIYLNRDIAPDDYFFRPGDIVVFHRISEFNYNMKKYREGDFEYESFAEKIESSKLRGLHALLDEL